MSEAVEPLAEWLAREQRAGVRVVGINGAQGSGKSTLARGLQSVLAARHGLRASILSLDDCYLTQAERRRLAREVHPLLATRGVPGTHDVALGRRLLAELHDLPAGASLALPRFVKTLDDRAPPAPASRVDGPVDLVLFEGWCVGTPPQDEAELARPVNALERDEDADGRWRRHVNAALAGPYADWFAALDRQVFLAVPDFDAVRRWRRQQEDDNRREAAGGAGLDEAALERFVQHFERLTRHALSVLPAQADVTLRLRPDHGLADLRWRGP